MAKAPKKTPRTRSNFQADYNRGFVSQKVKLGSHPAQTIFEKTFKETNEVLFSLGVVLRSIATDEEAAAAQKVVDVLLKSISDEIAAEGTRLDKLLEENGIHEEVAFSAPKEVVAEISSPRSSRYLMLIRDIDNLVAKMTALWLCGVLVDAQYSKGNFQWIGRMRTLSVQIRNIDRRAKSSASRKRLSKAEGKAKGSQDEAGGESEKDAPQTQGADLSEKKPTDKAKKKRSKKAAENQVEAPVANQDEDTPSVELDDVEASDVETAEAPAANLDEDADGVEMAEREATDVEMAESESIQAAV